MKNLTICLLMLVPGFARADILCAANCLLDNGNVAAVTGRGGTPQTAIQNLIDACTQQATQSVVSVPFGKAHKFIGTHQISTSSSQASSFDESRASDFDVRKACVGTPD